MEITALEVQVWAVLLMMMAVEMEVPVEEVTQVAVVAV
jgi:hypothetical protein